MIIKIRYKFSPEVSYPFIATTTIDGVDYDSRSKSSFDEAKGELMKKIAELLMSAPTIIPEPEEVDLDQFVGYPEVGEV